MKHTVHLRRCRSNDIDLVPVFLLHHPWINGHGTFVSLEDNDIGRVNQVVVAHIVHLIDAVKVNVFFVERTVHSLNAGKEGGTSAQGFLLCTSKKRRSTNTMVVGIVEYGYLLALVLPRSLETSHATNDVPGVGASDHWLPNIVIMSHHILT